MVADPVFSEKQQESKAKTPPKQNGGKGQGQGRPPQLTDHERIVQLLRTHRWQQGRILHRYGRCACGWKQGHLGRNKNVDHAEHVGQRIKQILANPSGQQGGGLKQAITHHTVMHFFWGLIKAKMGVPHV